MPLFNINYDPAAARRRQKLEELGKTIYNIQTQTGPMAGPMPPGQERPEITTQTPTGLFASQPEVGQFMRAAAESPYGGEVVRSLLSQYAPSQQKIGTYNPRDYTTESWAKFRTSGNPADLERYTEQVVMIGNVPHRRDPTTGQLVPLTTFEKVLSEEERLAAAKKGAEQRETSRRKFMDTAVTQIGNIQDQTGTMQEAIRLVEQEGASTGPIMDMLPSLTAASKKLENLRNKAGLDVIKGVTLGSISEKELDLVQTVGLPKGLKGPALVQYAKDKIAALNKVSNILMDQIRFLKENPTKDSADYWLMQSEKKRQTKENVPRETPTATSGETYEQRRKRLLGK